MKNIFVYILLLISLLTVSCVDDDFVVPGGVGDNEVYARIAFGHKNFEKIDITTRATLSEIAESRVENIFVYIFDNTGKRLYSHYYDYSNRVETLPQKVGNYWTVSNRTTTNNSDTRGEVLIKTPELEGGSIYMIVNLNADQLNISSNQLNLIESVSELQALTVTLNELEGFVNWGTPIQSYLLSPKEKQSTRIILSENQILTPVFKRRLENTKLTVGTGSVVVLGGLKEARSVKYEDKLPVLGDLPMVGRLFRSQGEEKIRKAFLMFVKVDVVDPTGRSAGTGERPSDVVD